MGGGGNHIPDFGFGDPDGGSIIDLGFGGTDVLVTTFPPTTAPPTTEPPISAPFGSLPLGTRVSGVFSYRGGERRLVARMWAELDNRHVVGRTLQAPMCTLELISEDGSIVGGSPVHGRFDAADLQHVRFLVNGFTPDVGHNYLARVTLRTVAGEVVGPRTFPLPVA